MTAAVCKPEINKRHMRKTGDKIVSTVEILDVYHPEQPVCCIRKVF